MSKVDLFKKIFFTGCVALPSVLLGCANTLKTSGPHEQNSIKNGINYHLPVDVINISSEETYTETKFIAFAPEILVDNPADLKSTLDKCLPIKETKSQIYKPLPVKVHPTEDTSHHFTINITPSAFTDSTISITRGSSLIREISIDTTGKAGEVTVGGLKTIASLAGAFTGIGIEAPPQSSMPNTMLGASFDLAENATDAKKATALPQNCSAWAKEKISEYSGKKVDNLNEFSDIEKYTLLSSKVAVDLLVKRRDKNEWLKSVEERKKDALEKLTQTKDKDSPIEPLVNKSTIL